jgi:hypothetical protein
MSERGALSQWNFTERRKAGFINEAVIAWSKQPSDVFAALADHQRSRRWFVRRMTEHGAALERSLILEDVHAIRNEF